MSGIGLNLRCSYKLSQGQRKYMEDVHVTKFLEDEEGEAQLAFFAVYDGHGGRHAAEFAKQRLLREITSQDLFWSDNDDDVLKAIKIAFNTTHDLMWKEIGKWPKTWSGRPSTAGTTASVAIIRDGKLYIGHVGDSAIVLGYREKEGDPLLAKRLTEDHKPETPEEKKRIEEMGGRVFSGKSGVLRVVWNRPDIAHKGPIRRSTQLEQIPFLAVARSLGDLWSYDYFSGDYAVSPDPDVICMHLDPKKHLCLILGSDGLWNMMSPQEAVSIAEQVETEIEQKFLNDPELTQKLATYPMVIPALGLNHFGGLGTAGRGVLKNVAENYWINPSTRLVDTALLRWSMNNMRADNTTAITVMIDPYGPRKSERLMQQRKLLMSKKTKDKNKDECITNSPLTQLRSPSRVIPVLSKLDQGFSLGDSMDTFPSFDDVDGPVRTGTPNVDTPGSSATKGPSASPHNKPYSLTRVSNISPTPVAANSSVTCSVSDSPTRNLRNKSSKTFPPEPSDNSNTTDSSPAKGKDNSVSCDNPNKTETDSKSVCNNPSQKSSPNTKVLRNQKTPKAEGRSLRGQISRKTPTNYTCENSVKISNTPVVSCKTIDGDDVLTPRRITRGLLKDSALAQNANNVVSNVTAGHGLQDVQRKAAKVVPRATRQTPSKSKFTNIKRKMAETPSPNLRRKRMKVHVN